MTTKKPVIYFAAPLFTQAEWQWNARLAKELGERGMDIILPQNTAEPMLKDSNTFNAHKLFSANTTNIDNADLVLAILDLSDPDSGTSWECGYAYKSKRPIVGLRTDIRPAGEDPNKPVNLMISESCNEFVVVPQDKREDLVWVAQEVAMAIFRALQNEIGH